MANIPDKLGIGNEVREFKLGRSFVGNSATAFHSVRYDFKPASVDTSKMATLAIGDRHQVTVTVPHVEGNAQAVFMGSKKQYQKECVFIIDHNTGEITLEKLSSNIQLKKTRSEGSSRSLQSRPITPIDLPAHQPISHTKKPSPSHSRYSPSSSHQVQKGGLSSPNQNRSNPWTSSSPQTSPNNPATNPSMPNILAPAVPPPPPLQNTNYRQSSAPNRSSSSRVSPSMPQFLSSAETKEVPGAPEIGILSGSSSDSSSSSSSDNSDNEAKVKKKKKKRSSGSSEANSDSDDPDEHLRTDHRKKPTTATTSSVATNQSAGNSSMLPSMPSMPSMPKFSQLSQDLQLSESGSDSDD